MKMLYILFFWVFSIFQPEMPELNKQNVWKIIKSSGIEHPDIVFAQALLESGDFKSKLTRSNNNIFGMKMPKYRKTLAIGSKNGYANYNHWIQSILDYKVYQDFITNGKQITRSEYLKKIGRNYSETYDYLSRVNRVLKENRHIISI